MLNNQHTSDKFSVFMLENFEKIVRIQPKFAFIANSGGVIKYFSGEYEQTKSEVLFLSFISALVQFSNELFSENSRTGADEGGPDDCSFIRFTFFDYNIDIFYFEELLIGYSYQNPYPNPRTLIMAFSIVLRQKERLWKLISDDFNVIDDNDKAQLDQLVYKYLTITKEQKRKISEFYQRLEEEHNDELTYLMMSDLQK